jgi:hypothetical protein
MKLPAILLLFLLFANVPVFAQVKIQVVKGSKQAYGPNDQIQVQIQAKSLPETCAAGMKLTKVFVSGFEMSSQSEWKMLAKGLWVKELQLSVLGNGAREGKLTVIRRVDKESLFKQEIFPFQGS